MTDDGEIHTRQFPHAILPPGKGPLKPVRVVSLGGVFRKIRQKEIETKSTEAATKGKNVPCHAFGGTKSVVFTQKPATKGKLPPYHAFRGQAGWRRTKKKTGIFRSFCNALKINYFFFFAALLAAAA